MTKITKENKILFIQENTKLSIEETKQLYIERIENLEKLITKLKNEMENKCLEINRECDERVKRIRESN